MRLDTKSIVVTGASSGLGKAMANAFVAEGAAVVCSSHNRDRLSAAVEEISDRNSDGETTAVVADVRSWDDVQRLVRRSREEYGEIDVLVNNAGVLQYKITDDHTDRPVVDVPVDVWDTVLNTNLRGAFLCSKAALSGMLSRGDGRLIHISSGHGTEGRATRAPYVASKFGLEGFHESLALELDATGVDSIALRPPGGGVYTESSELIGRSPESYPNESPDVIAEAAVRLAAGEGENGGRYQATSDDRGYETYVRS